MKALRDHFYGKGNITRRTVQTVLIPIAIIVRNVTRCTVEAVLILIAIIVQQLPTPNNLLSNEKGKARLPLPPLRAVSLTQHDPHRSFFCEIRDDTVSCLLF